MTKRVLITGSSSGIGFDTALVLAEAGWSVVATMRNLDKREALESAAKSRGLELEIRHLDVAKPSSIESCVNGVESELGPIDALINNAGRVAWAVSSSSITKRFTRSWRPISSASGT